MSHNCLAQEAEGWTPVTRSRDAEDGSSTSTWAQNESHNWRGSRRTQLMSAFGSKADMDRCTAYVCAAARIGEAAKRGGLQRKNTRLNATLQTPSR